MTFQGILQFVLFISINFKWYYQSEQALVSFKRKNRLFINVGKKRRKYISLGSY